MTLSEEIAQSPAAREALEAIIRHFSAESGTIHAIRRDGLLHLVAAIGAFPEPVMAEIRVIPVGKDMAGLAAERRKPVDSCNKPMRAGTSAPTPGQQAWAAPLPCRFLQAAVIGALALQTAQTGNSTN